MITFKWVEKDGVVMNDIQWTEELAEEWGNRTTGRLYIRDQEHFRQSEFFLNQYSELKTEIESILNGEITDQKFSMTYAQRKEGLKYLPRLKSTPLNKGIRQRFHQSNLDFKYEVTYKEGIFYDSKKNQGFDFALWDQEYNFMNFRNLCFGRRALSYGKDHWNKEIRKNSGWEEMNEKLGADKLQKGVDVDHRKRQPTILGEIQFGNWGLVYRDILKVVQVERDEDVDLLIYITATGNLDKRISTATVNFNKTKKLFEEFKNVLSMPIWLIGIDIE